MGRTVPFEDRHRPVVEPAPDPSRRRRKGAAEPSVILGADGQPARLPAYAKCPDCGAGPDQRVKAAFGPIQFVCQKCGHEFQE